MGSGTAAGPACGTTGGTTALRGSLPYGTTGTAAAARLPLCRRAAGGGTLSRATRGGRGSGRSGVRAEGSALLRGFDAQREEAAVVVVERPRRDDDARVRRFPEEALCRRAERASRLDAGGAWRTDGGARASHKTNESYLSSPRLLSWVDNGSRPTSHPSQSRRAVCVADGSALIPFPRSSEGPQRDEVAAWKQERAARIDTRRCAAGRRGAAGAQPRDGRGHASLPPALCRGPEETGLPL